MREHFLCKLCKGAGFIREGKLLRNCHLCNSPAKVTTPKLHPLADIMIEHSKKDKPKKTTWIKKVN